MSFLGTTGPVVDDRTNELEGVDLFASNTGGSGSNSGTSGSDSGGDDFVFDAERHISPDKRNADGSYRRKRAKRGTGGNSTPSKPRSKAADKAGVEGLTRILVVLHAGVSATTGVEEIAIDETEGKVLAESTANLLDQFNIRPDPKIEAVIGLIMACGIVYGPRVAAYNMRKKADAAAVTQ